MFIEGKIRRGAPLISIWPKLVLALMSFLTQAAEIPGQVHAGIQGGGGAAWSRAVQAVPVTKILSRCIRLATGCGLVREANSKTRATSR